MRERLRVAVLLPNGKRRKRRHRRASGSELGKQVIKIFNKGVRSEGLIEE